MKTQELFNQAKRLIIGGAIVASPFLFSRCEKPEPLIPQAREYISRAG